MSFNINPKPVISLSNYEEYFLLYVDKELNADEKKAVEAFVIGYPHLQEELDLLCSTRLPESDLKLDDKSGLFSGSMRMHTLDESLLLYIDDELPEAERKDLESRIAGNPDYELQYRLLLKTKAEASESITCPDKATLYRHTDRRILRSWLRIAAAVVLLAGSGAVLWNSNDGTKPQVDLVATPERQKTTIEDAMPPVVTVQQPEIDVQKFAGAPEKEHPGKTTATKALTASSVEIIANLMPDGQKRSNNLPVPVAKEKEQVAVNAQNEMPQTTQQIISDPVVTTADARAYNNLEATNTNPVLTSVSEPASQEKGGSLKGLLRKATRFIERRTGVTATNENEELLIGAVAIKLK